MLWVWEIISEPAVQHTTRTVTSVTACITSLNSVVSKVIWVICLIMVSWAFAIIMMPSWVFETIRTPNRVVAIKMKLYKNQANQDQDVSRSIETRPNIWDCLNLCLKQSLKCQIMFACSVYMTLNQSNAKLRSKVKIKTFSKRKCIKRVVILVMKMFQILIWAIFHSVYISCLKNINYVKQI